jgi:hypothetical protein
MAYFKYTDHCTRCHALLAEDAIAFMVSEDVIWQVIGAPGDQLGMFQSEVVPVCFACLTEHEATQLNLSEKICQGCGRKMMVPPKYSGAFCSTRCAARARRARGRMKAQRCIVCHKSFQTTRTDASFCSNACRQHAYRLRSSDA